jgi:hypothetical protein
MDPRLRGGDEKNKSYQRSAGIISTEFVMPGPVPGIHAVPQHHRYRLSHGVDGRDKPGHDAM